MGQEVRAAKEGERMSGFCEWWYVCGVVTTFIGIVLSREFNEDGILIFVTIIPMLALLAYRVSKFSNKPSPEKPPLFHEESSNDE